ncbi:hypothetical protein AB1Y20_006050 [Prymnesium parvum]|uniref:Uncharacterized protein n=1 Tax=Prymnesium parvum TaxID=97485 RepID=A0AB34J2V1_PRYPA
MSALHWARYLRKVQLTFNPFVKSSAVPMLGILNTKKIKEMIPQLVVAKKLLPRGEETASMSVSFADNSQMEFDLVRLQNAMIIEKIEMENVRIAVVEVERGKPFS